MSVVPVYQPQQHLPARTALSSHPKLVASLGTLREIGIVGLAVYIYFAVRGLIHSREAEAVDNANWLIGKEKMLGIFHEGALNEWASRHEAVFTFFNTFYIFGHWPVVAGTLVWLFFSHREAFAQYRNAMLISGLVGFVFFFLFPMAPPRLVPDIGFVDTVTLHSDAYRVLQPPSLTNQFAAMPSLHVGWNLLMGIAIFRYSRLSAWKLFAIAMPLTMYVATILTANHYFTDGVVGSILALSALAVAVRIASRKRPVWTETRIVPEPVGPTAAQA